MRGPTEDSSQKALIRARLALLHDWAVSLHVLSADDRGQIHQAVMDGARPDVLGAVELLMSEWSPAAARIAAGRPLRSTSGFEEALNTSLFETPAVMDFLAGEPGHVHFRRYLEAVEMLRLALLASLSE